MNRKYDSFRTCRECEMKLPLNRHCFTYVGKCKDGSPRFRYKCVKCYYMTLKLKRMGEIGKEKLARTLEAA